MDYLIKSKSLQLDESSQILKHGADSLDETIGKEGIFFQGVLHVLHVEYFPHEQIYQSVFPSFCKNGNFAPPLMETFPSRSVLESLSRWTAAISAVEHQNSSLAQCLAFMIYSWIDLCSTKTENRGLGFRRGAFTVRMSLALLSKLYSLDERRWDSYGFNFPKNSSSEHFV